MWQFWRGYFRAASLTLRPLDVFCWWLEEKKGASPYRQRCFACHEKSPTKGMKK